MSKNYLKQIGTSTFQINIIFDLGLMNKLFFDHEMYAIVIINIIQGSTDFTDLTKLKFQQSYFSNHWFF